MHPKGMHYKPQPLKKKKAHMLISNYSIHHRTTILVVLTIIVITGMSAYMTLPRESAPDIEFPFITVVGSYEGASPSDIESLVTYPIERKLKNLTDVKKMESTSSEGSSVIFLEFEPGIDIDTALQKVRDKVDEAGPDLPDDMQDDPMVNEVSATEEWPVMYVNISGDVGLVRLKDIAEDMEEDFEGVRGVLGLAVLVGLLGWLWIWPYRGEVVQVGLIVQTSGDVQSSLDVQMSAVHRPRKHEGP